MGQSSSSANYHQPTPIDFSNDELYAHLIQWRKEKFQRIMNDDPDGLFSPQQVVVGDAVLQEVVKAVRSGKVKTQDDLPKHGYRKTHGSVECRWVDPEISTEMFLVALLHKDRKSNGPPGADQNSGKSALVGGVKQEGNGGTKGRKA